MDNTNNAETHPVLDAIPGVGTAVSVVSSLATGIRNKAKAKKAQKISDAGGYNTLTPFQKSLIGVPAYAINITNPTADDAKNAEAIPITIGQLKNYIPYILGIVILGLVIYFIVKKKK